MKIRIKFSKYGNMRFVGHLDLMRYFQRALRRAGIDMAYTEGFNPHPQLSFALPLGIGLTSVGEYMDLTVNSTGTSADSIQNLNSVMAEGVAVTGYALLPEEAKNAMASVSAADYIVYFKHREDASQSEISSDIQAYYKNRSSIEVVKPTKKGGRILDLKPLIYELQPCEDKNGRGFFLRLSAGSNDNVRPELVIEDYYSFLGLSFDPFNLHIHRLDLYESISSGDKEHEFISLGSFGEEIL